MQREGNVLGIKKLHMVLSLIAIVLTLLATISYPFAWKQQIDHDLSNAKHDIELLKANKDLDHELLIEIKMNLRQFMQSQGYGYIENTDYKKNK